MSLFSSQPTSSQSEEYFCNAAEEEEDNKKLQQEEGDREDENYNPSSLQQYSSQSYITESDDDDMSSQPSDGPQGRENERKMNNVVRGGDLEGFVTILLGLIENGKSSQLEAAVRLASKIMGGRG